MKYFISAILILMVSIFGFIVAPMFILGVDLTHIPVVDTAPQAIEARENIKKYREKKGVGVSVDDLEKWRSIIDSQPRKVYTDKELYHIAQSNFLWFSWLPVFILFCFISNSKIRYFVYFIGTTFLAFLLEYLVLSTLLTYIGAAFLGLFLNEICTRKRNANKGPE